MHGYTPRQRGESKVLSISTTVCVRCGGGGGGGACEQARTQDFQKGGSKMYCGLTALTNSFPLCIAAQIAAHTTLFYSIQGSSSSFTADHTNNSASQMNIRHISTHPRPGSRDHLSINTVHLVGVPKAILHTKTTFFALHRFHCRCSQNNAYLISTACH